MGRLFDICRGCAKFPQKISSKLSEHKKISYNQELAEQSEILETVGDQDPSHFYYGQVVAKMLDAKFEALERLVSHFLKFILPS